MGFFDTLKVMKDIVSGGIASFQAGEKLDELIKKVEDDYEDVLSADEKKLLKNYKRSMKAYDDNSDTDKNDELIDKLDDDRLAFLEALQKNSSLPKSFRNEIKTAIEEFKNADNSALDSLGEVLEKNAENDEQRAEVRKTINQSKRK
ncbi:MAG: hypothetical protein IJL14_07830 [Selenomonadaceae bacterium]|nr:hypothetical protein [Selenomonadaceae bacterium]